jgi:hypothetical protein
MASSSVDIANQAFVELGHTTITNFEEDSPAARLAKLNYADIRDQVLRDHPWNFASFRVSIPSTGTAPAFNYTNAYTIPADSLKIKRVNFQDPGAGSWVIEGDEILTDLGSPIEVEYIRRITSVGVYDSSFVRALALSLAYAWCEKLAKASTLKEQIRNDLAIVLQNARTSDGQESSVRVFVDGTWLTHRSGYGRGYWWRD